MSINHGLQQTVRTYIDNKNTKVAKPWIKEDCKNLYRQYTLKSINHGLQRTVRTYIDNTNNKVDKPWITEDCKKLYRQYKH